MPILKKVQPGTPFAMPAATFNAMLDSTKLSRRRYGIQGAARISSKATSSSIVLIENKSGKDVDRFGILGLGAPIFLPAPRLDSFLNQIGFTGELPVVATHAGKFAICLEPIGKDRIGRAYVGGVCPVLIDMPVEGNGYADIADDDVEKLTSATSGGAEILYAEEGIGIKWALVRFPVSAAISGTSETPYEMLPATLEGPATAQIDTWDRANPPAVVPATDPITYYDGVKYKGPRVVYDDTAGTPKILGYSRAVTYDSAGAVAFIDVEVEYNIDTPGVCP